MSKSKIGIMFVLVLLATSITFAQSFFSSSGATAPAAAPGASTPQPLSPDDFKSLSSQQNQKTQAQINQQVNKSMAAQPFPMPAPPIGATAAKPQNPTPVVPEAPANNSTTDANTSQPAAPAADASQAAPAASDQPYTGFQSTPPANNSNSKSGGTSTQQGLGIKY